MIELILKAAGRVLDALPLWAIGSILCFTGGVWVGIKYAEMDKADSLAGAIDQAQQVASGDQENVNNAAAERTKIEIRYRTIIKRIPADPAPGCADLGLKFGSVWNDATRSARLANQAP